jgi:hypothetical protein
MTVDDEIIRAMMMFVRHPPEEYPEEYQIEILHPGDQPPGRGEITVIRRISYNEES